VYTFQLHVVTHIRTEGGCGLVLTRADLAADAPRRPVYVLGGNGDSGGTAYKNPPTWELGGHRRPDLMADDNPAEDDRSVPLAEGVVSIKDFRRS